MRVEEVTPGLVCCTTLIANVYLVGERGGPWAVVDTAIPKKGAQIRDAAAHWFGATSRPGAILLTHGHFDHAGSALELAALWDVPIYAHKLERPYLTGRSPYAPKDPTVGGAMALLSRFFPSKTIDLGTRVRDLPDDGSVPGLPGWRWYHTPGHAPGHVVFWQPDRRVLLAGDACTTMDLDTFAGLLTRRPRISRPPAPFTCDWNQAHRSVELLAGLRPAVLGAGHGPPMTGEVVISGLATLAVNFPRPRTQAHR
jgi:glyoxylase-like metal-dependent hydrolase (beta-lactamase superfamily II)